LKLLPSEQKDAKERAGRMFHEDGSILLGEPCDCGGQIRHNNGGNYHEIVMVVLDEGRYFVQYSDTCELTDAKEWCEITKEEAKEIIEENATKGYLFY